MPKPARRKQLLIEKKLQLAIIRTIVTYGIILSAVFLIGLYFISDAFIRNIFEAQTLDDNLRFSLYQKLNYIILGFFFFSVILTFVSSYISLIFSNMVAGPVYNINQVLEKNQAEGKSDLIKLRTNDYFQTLATNINQLIAKRNDTQP